MTPKTECVNTIYNAFSNLSGKVADSEYKWLSENILRKEDDYGIETMEGSEEAWSVLVRYLVLANEEYRSELKNPFATVARLFAEHGVKHSSGVFHPGTLFVVESTEPKAKDSLDDNGLIKPRPDQ